MSPRSATGKRKLGRREADHSAALSVTAARARSALTLRTAMTAVVAARNNVARNWMTSFASTTTSDRSAKMQMTAIDHVTAVDGESNLRKRNDDISEYESALSARSMAHSTFVHRSGVWRKILSHGPNRNQKANKAESDRAVVSRSRLAMPPSRSARDSGSHHSDLRPAESDRPSPRSMT